MAEYDALINIIHEKMKFPTHSFLFRWQENIRAFTKESPMNNSKIVRFNFASSLNRFIFGEIY